MRQKLTKDQQVAIKRLHERSADGAASYLQFRRRAYYSSLMGCVMLTWHNMTVGIETDGYTHS